VSIYKKEKATTTGVKMNPLSTTHSSSAEGQPARTHLDLIKNLKEEGKSGRVLCDSRLKKRYYCYR
jgi:hypothetical protein